MTITPPQAGRCAGTHAAAGPIPADSLSYPAPDVSQGPRPAEHRPAIPTRAYEAGSGARRHHPAPAHRPHPPRPPPSAVGRWPGRKRTGPPLRRQGCCASRCARQPCGPAVTPEPLRPPGQETRTGRGLPPAGPARPAAAARVHPAGTDSPGGKWTACKNAHGKRTLSDQPPGDLQKLDGPFHMRSPGSGTDEVVVDVLFPFVAEERDDVPEARVARL